MRWILGWLTGTVSVLISGAQPETFLNLSAKQGLVLWKARRRDDFTLWVVVARRDYPRLKTLAERARCEAVLEKTQGLPYFLLRFRRRYALWAGLVLCLVLALAGSRTVLTIDVVGNVKLTDQEIISQLRLCGVHIGTYSPSVSMRTVSNRMMMAMDELTFCAVNFHGTRVEVVVREGEEGPELRNSDVPTDIISSATGIITHMEPWFGQAMFQEGDTVMEGDVLIAGDMFLEPPATAPGAELGRMLVHAEGRVLARTWHTMTAQLSLSAQGKAYTGEEITRRSLSLMGQRVKFYQNSGIPYEKYDTISQLKVWTPGKALPILWQKETCREYTLVPMRLDRQAAEAYLRAELLEKLEAGMEEGKVLKTDYETTLEGDLLTVTLLAECTEQIGRMTPMDTQQRSDGPYLPEDADPTQIKEQSP